MNPFRIMADSMKLNRLKDRLLPGLHTYVYTMTGFDIYEIDDLELILNSEIVNAKMTTNKNITKIIDHEFKVLALFAVFKRLESDIDKRDILLICLLNVLAKTDGVIDPIIHGLVMKGAEEFILSQPADYPDRLKALYSEHSLRPPSA